MAIQTGKFLSELGIATGIYDGDYSASAGYESASLWMCSGKALGGNIKMSDFTGSFVNDSTGSYGGELNPSGLVMVVNTGASIDYEWKMRFENTGSRFYRILNRWENFKKQINVDTAVWEEDCSHFVLKASAGDGGVGYRQSGSVIGTATGPAATTTYEGTLTGYWCDFYNDRAKVGYPNMAAHSQSAYIAVKKPTGAPGPGG